MTVEELTRILDSGSIQEKCNIITSPNRVKGTTLYKSDTGLFSFYKYFNIELIKGLRGVITTKEILCILLSDQKSSLAEELINNGIIKLNQESFDYLDKSHSGQYLYLAKNVAQDMFIERIFDNNTINITRYINHLTEYNKSKVILRAINENDSRIFKECIDSTKVITIKDLEDRLISKGLQNWLIYVDAKVEVNRLLQEEGSFCNDCGRKLIIREGKEICYSCTELRKICAEVNKSKNKYAIENGMLYKIENEGHGDDSILNMEGILISNCDLKYIRRVDGIEEFNE